MSSLDKSNIHRILDKVAKQIWQCKTEVAVAIGKHFHRFPVIGELKAFHYFRRHDLKSV